MGLRVKEHFTALLIFKHGKTCKFLQIFLKNNTLGSKLNSKGEVMKKVIPFLILGCFLIGYFQKKVVDISKEQEINGLVYVVGDEKPFTGKIVQKHENGQTQIEYSYTKGKLSGSTKVFDENGKIERALSFENGKLSGTQKIFHPNGQIYREFVVKDDNLDGISKAYYYTGKPKSESYIEEGERKLKTFYGKFDNGISVSELEALPYNTLFTMRKQHMEVFMYTIETRPELAHALALTMEGGVTGSTKIVYFEIDAEDPNSEYVEVYPVYPTGTGWIYKR